MLHRQQTTRISVNFNLMQPHPIPDCKKNNETPTFANVSSLASATIANVVITCSCTYLLTPVPFSFPAPAPFPSADKPAGLRSLRRRSTIGSR